MAENPDHTAAFKVFNYGIRCLVPTMYLYSEEYVKKFGIVVSGDNSVDNAAASAPVQTTATPAVMAVWFSQGAKIVFIEPKDSVRVYEYIIQHLKDWENSIRGDFSRTTDPEILNDLRILESFAAEVYLTARHYLPEETSKSGLFGALERLGQRGPLARQKKPDPSLQENPFPKEHNNVIDKLIMGTDNRRTGGRPMTRR